MPESLSLIKLQACNSCEMLRNLYEHLFLQNTSAASANRFIHDFISLLHYNAPLFAKIVTSAVRPKLNT